MQRLWSGSFADATLCSTAPRELPCWVPEAAKPLCNAVLWPLATRAPTHICLFVKDFTACCLWVRILFAAHALTCLPAALATSTAAIIPEILRLAEASPEPEAVAAASELALPPCVPDKKRLLLPFPRCILPSCCYLQPAAPLSAKQLPTWVVSALCRALPGHAFPAMLVFKCQHSCCCRSQQDEMHNASARACTGTLCRSTQVADSSSCSCRRSIQAPAVNAWMLQAFFASPAFVLAPSLHLQQHLPDN